MDTFLYHESQTLTHIINNYCLHATPLYGQTSFLQHALSIINWISYQWKPDRHGRFTSYQRFCPVLPGWLSPDNTDTMVSYPLGVCINLSSTVLVFDSCLSLLLKFYFDSIHVNLCKHFFDTFLLCLCITKTKPLLILFLII